jgi:hypothetical protein
MPNKLIIIVVIGVIVVITLAVIGIMGILSTRQIEGPTPTAKIVSTTKAVPTDVAKLPQVVPPITPTTQTPAPIPARQLAGGDIGLKEPLDIEFQLTGSIILQNFKSAFILNTLTKIEKVYQEKDQIKSEKHGIWTICHIKSDEVLLQQYHPDGSVARESVLFLKDKSLPQGKQPPSTGRYYNPGEKKTAPTAPDGSGLNIRSPEDIDKFISETPVSDLLSIVRSVPEGLIDIVLTTLPEDYLRKKLEQSALEAAISDETFKEHKPAEIIKNLLRVHNDFTLPVGEKLLVFATAVNPDNSPVSRTTVFPPETKRIYACFKNEGVLSKLDRVIIKWVNQTTKNIVYWSAFMITKDAEYNYIFLKPEGRWERGKYFACLYKKVSDPTPIAWGEFEIK